MARFYGTFDNSTNSGLEAASAGNYYERKAFTDGTTLQTALVNTRAALSSAVYGQLNAVNQNGDLGIVVPSGAITIGGGSLSFGNVYTNTGAVWPSDPRVRPTEQITVANSVAVSPVDGGSITASLYTDATTALGNALAGIADGGPNGRLGLDTWRTLASLWHDHALTFLAWDDFTPGQVQGLSTAEVGGAGSLAVTIQWTDYEFVNDSNAAGKVLVVASLGSTTGGNNYSFNSGLIAPPGAKEVVWNAAPTADTYELTATVTVYDAVIPAHEGTFATTSKTITVS
jgi:hypothetical protein